MVRYGPDEALALLRGVTRVVSSRGTKVTELDLKKDKPDEATLLAHLLGPTGNLRAPAAKVGATLLVGFNPDAYRRVLGR
jgi:arsenate reductase-like glutaredoxin family protein